MPQIIKSQYVQDADQLGLLYTDDRNAKFGEVLVFSKLELM